LSPKACDLQLTVPEELLDALAERVARRIGNQLAPPGPASPWLDVEAALEYLPFSHRLVDPKLAWACVLQEQAYEPDL
jgi:hypothetical protein